MPTHIYGGGECGELIRTYDWSTTGLGAIATWPTELVSVVNSTLNSPLACVLLIGAEGYLIYNDSYARFAADKHPAIFGMPVTAAWPEVADFNLDIMRRVGDGETISLKDQQLKLRRSGSDFENIFLDLNYSPVYVADDAIGGVQAWVIETTELVESRRDERAARQALDKEREERNELEQLSDSKDQFIALVSHQLRTPATAVKQYISLLLRGFSGELNDQQRQYAERAFISNERQLDIINDMLKIAQIDAGRYLLHLKDTDLKAVVAAAIDEIRPMVIARKQKIKVRIAEADIVLLLDDAEMNVVFVNILENASKYSPPGSILDCRITADTTAATVAISDQGVGLTKKDQKHIFEKFTRINNVYSDTVTGSGLGLYLTEQIVKLHDGSVTISSKPGKGSTFTVRLPYGSS